MSKKEGGSDMATGKGRQGGASDSSWCPAKLHICSLSNPVPPLPWQVTKGMHASMERVDEECSTGSMELVSSKALARWEPPTPGWARVHCRSCQTIGELPKIK